MAVYAIDVPAYVTLRVRADSEEEAVGIVRDKFDLGIHEFGTDDQETESPGVVISPAVTIYAYPYKTDWKVSAPMLEATLDDDA